MINKLASFVDRDGSCTMINKQPRFVDCPESWTATQKRQNLLIMEDAAEFIQKSQKGRFREGISACFLQKFAQIGIIAIVNRIFKKSANSRIGPIMSAFFKKIAPRGFGAIYCDMPESTL